jgi:hypothetical protein
VPQFPDAAAPLADLRLAVLAVSEQPVGGELLAAPYREQAQPTEDASLEIMHGAIDLHRDYARAVVKAIQAVVQTATDRSLKS